MNVSTRAFCPNGGLLSKGRKHTGRAPSGAKAPYVPDRRSKVGQKGPDTDRSQASIARVDTSRVAEISWREIAVRRKAGRKGLNGDRRDLLSLLPVPPPLALYPPVHACPRESGGQKDKRVPVTFNPTT